MMNLSKYFLLLFCFTGIAKASSCIQYMANGSSSKVEHLIAISTDEELGCSKNKVLEDFRIIKKMNESDFIGAVGIIDNAIKRIDLNTRNSWEIRYIPDADSDNMGYKIEVNQLLKKENHRHNSEFKYPARLDPDFSASQQRTDRITPPPGNVNNHLFSDEVTSDAFKAGYTFVQLAESGVLERGAECFKNAYSSLVLGTQPIDHAFANQMGDFVNKAREMFQKMEQDRMEKLDKMKRDNARARYNHRLKRIELNQGLEEINDAMAGIREALREGPDFSSINEKCRAGTEEQLRRNREKFEVNPDFQVKTGVPGGFSPEFIDGLKESLDREQRQANGDLSYLRSLQDLNGLNETRRQQIQELLNAHLNSDGLVKNWAEKAGIAENTLKTDKDSPAGKTIRNILNETLSLFSGEYNVEESKEKLENAIEFSIKSDAIFHAYRAAEKHVAERYLNQAKEINEFTSNSPKVEKYAEISFSEDAQELFNMDLSGDSYENYQMTKVANKLAALPSIGSDSMLHFHSVVAMNNAQHASQRNNFTNFSRSLDLLWGVYDVGVGVALGLKDFTVDTVSGLVHMVSHPIDSVSAIFGAIYNHEKTTETIVVALADTIDDLEEYSLQEKARLYTKVGAEVGSLFLGIGAFKKAGDASKIAKTLKEAALLKESNQFGLAIEKVTSFCVKVRDSAKKSGVGDKIGPTLKSATAPAKPGSDMTKLGHAFQKHAGRNATTNPGRWGKVSGSNATKNETGLRHFNEILEGPGKFQKITTAEGKTFLEKRLSDGRGIRLNQDGTFKGFVDP